MESSRILTDADANYLLGERVVGGVYLNPDCAYYSFRLCAGTTYCQSGDLDGRRECQRENVPHHGQNLDEVHHARVLNGISAPDQMEKPMQSYLEDLT